MPDAPEATPEEEPVVVDLPKSAAAAWKERRALIVERNSAARDRSNSAKMPADNRVAEQRRRNSERDSTQIQVSNANLTRKRPRG